MKAIPRGDYAALLLWLEGTLLEQEQLAPRMYEHISGSGKRQEVFCRWNQAPVQTMKAMHAKSCQCVGCTKGEDNDEPMIIRFVRLSVRDLGYNEMAVKLSDMYPALSAWKDREGRNKLAFALEEHYRRIKILAKAEENGLLMAKQRPAQKTMNGVAALHGLRDMLVGKPQPATPQEPQQTCEPTEPQEPQEVQEAPAEVNEANMTLAERLQRHQQMCDAQRAAARQANRKGKTEADEFKEDPAVRKYLRNMVGY